MPDRPLIEELRSRIHENPASPAFAQLAEEYQRLGAFRQAAQVAREGLALNPRHTSARMILAEALLRLGNVEEGRRELATVLDQEPGYTAAARALDSIAEVELRRWLDALLADRHARTGMK